MNPELHEVLVRIHLTLDFVTKMLLQIAGRDLVLQAEYDRLWNEMLAAAEERGL